MSDEQRYAIEYLKALGFEVIPRAQLEAMMAATKVVTDRDSDPSTWMRKRYEALAALRAAGIDLEEKT